MTDTVETPPLAIDTSGPIRRFSDSAIQERVNKALATLPPDKKLAVVAVANQNEARLAVMARLGTQFSVMGVLEKPYKGELRAEAAVVFTPF
jgi:hypothetical protein